MKESRGGRVVDCDEDEEAIQDATDKMTHRAHLYFIVQNKTHKLQLISHNKQRPNKTKVNSIIGLILC